jgi:hypothetical protein
MVSAPELAGIAEVIADLSRADRSVSCTDGQGSCLFMPERNIYICVLTARDREFKHVFVL